VKRLHAVVLFVLGFAVAGVASGTVIADVSTSTSTSTDTTSTVATTTTAPTTTAQASGATIPIGVRVAGVRVGGLAPPEAVSAVQLAFRRPLPVVVDGYRLSIDPTRVASAYVTTAVARARISDTSTNVRLVVSVRGGPLRVWVAAAAKRFDRGPADASLTLRNGRPRITKAHGGRTLDTAALAGRIVAALQANSRLPVRVHTKTSAPAVSGATFTETIVINRSINKLVLYRGMTPERTFSVATGQRIYPTPAGRWHIVVKWRNPWWYPPTQDSWAKGLKPVPPGPGNPLGTRWMGLDAPGVGIHGTDEPSSIGYSASHGCIRMQVPDAEWLFDHVDIGTTVFII